MDESCCASYSVGGQVTALCGDESAILAGAFGSIPASRAGSGAAFLSVSMSGTNQKVNKEDAKAMANWPRT